MPEWMTNRFMVPVYALLISFGTALVLGAAMNPASPPAEPSDPAVALTIRLVAKQVAEQGVLDDGPVAELQGRQVRLYRAASDATLAVGEGGAVTVTPATGPLTVCVSLPKGWTGRAASQNAAPGSPCWELKAETGDVELIVVKGG